ncbi:MAG: DUF2236 domain-containing protein [Thermogemmatispora sp.]|jgi:uncharacterized protein (DUF2236 family)|uniref:oxygenase MpaB family protein n=1 Tax=Thermogemmatispora sp. TaxID=1968838 RepID=UPI0019DC0DBB|nr:oxygenase MpaB family protein [Thermogemmatispora sp.]MBE3567818.1 DUF2236 domain-containing protein [Thermogemmatispora sp.]
MREARQVEPGRAEAGLHGYYGPESVTWKVTREAAILLGGARAVLLQIAHPLVAEGVYTHSSYLTDPAARTLHTFMLGQILTFGDRPEAHEAARTINRLHAGVFGHLPQDAGAYRRGTFYRARDQELLLWVHATLVDTALLLYTSLIGPLTADEQERYYQESKAQARLLGLQPRYMPASLAELQHYVEEMVQSDQLAATPQARRLAHTVLFPPLPTVFRPVLHFHFLITCGLLPERLRSLYGYPWGPWHQQAFDLVMQGLRSTLPHLPLRLRTLPVTQHIIERRLSSARLQAYARSIREARASA